MTEILWLRRDLRLADHPALWTAAEAGEVLPVVLGDQQLAGGPAQRRRWESSVAALARATQDALVLRSGPAPEVLAQLAAEVGAWRVHCTLEATPQGRALEGAVANRLRSRGVELVGAGTGYAVAPGTLRSGAGTPYRSYGPFARAWRDHGAPPPLPIPEVRWRRGVRTDPLPTGSSGSGESAATARWHRFLADGLARYNAERDRPDLDSTSRLSVHLATGELHPRTLLADLAAHPEAGGGAVHAFLRELCWREFFADSLWHRPASAWSDQRPLDGLEHEPDGPLVEAWRQGRTGFPLVDAGMRQLSSTGRMHNRVRMVAASFLVKDLHAPWQIGAEHFLHHLIDADLASNNLNWQWVAGTGTDAAPYVRVFNPVRQGLRFDPDGDYVRRWIPELAHLPGAAAHEPWTHEQGHPHGYPARIVDHALERRETLHRFHRARAAARAAGF